MSYSNNRIGQGMKRAKIIRPSAAESGDFASEAHSADKNGKKKATSRFQGKREKIIAAGSDVINHQGVKGMTLASVAELVGLSTTSLTYYFKRKEDLAAACILRGIERLEALVETASSEAGPADRLAKFISLFFEVHGRIQRNEEAPICIFNDLRALNRTVSKPLMEAHDRLFEATREMLADPQHPVSSKRAAARALLFFMFVYWIPLWITRYDVEDYSRAAPRVIDVILNGLAPPVAGKWAPPPLRFEPEGVPDQKEMFLIAATQLINEQGYHGASVDKISARLKVTKGSFYHHLDTKDDLVALCFSRTFAIMADVQRAAIAMPENGWTQLVAACSALVELQFSGKGPLLEFSAFTALPQEMIVDTVRQSERIPHRFAEMISNGIADGSIRPVDPFIASQMVTAAINTITGLPAMLLQFQGDEALEIFIRPLFYGILND
jgi:AcrR family transcriptional regulator